MGAFQVNTWVALFATTGIILAAAYGLWLYRRVIFGPLVKDGLKGIMDLTRREQLILAPLVILTIFFGVYPQPILDVTAASVDHLLTNVQAAIDANAALATAQTP